MISRLAAAQRLDIPFEMAKRHGLPAQMHEEALAELEANPPAWLVQSRANRRGKRAVWAELTCSICDFSEKARPKKWWPEFTHLACDDHDLADAPAVAEGSVRSEVWGVGSRFVGLVDSPTA